MASGWQSKLARISQMGWEEIHARVSQEIHKQRDLFVHRIGGRAGTIRLRQDSSSKQEHFFFSDNESSARAELLRTHLPAEAADILREADEICGHRFRLLGYENLAYGDNIDWHLDAVHAKRAPLDPWSKIPFLDFAQVGDHKVIWELNRHQHFVTLAKARLLSGDNKYSRELIAQWHSWIKANPYPLGINWGSTLEVAFRSLSWIWVDHLLAGTPDYDQFRSELLPALAFHGRYIERYLSAYFSPNTHLLGEAVSLFFLGTLYPQMPRADHWRNSAWKIVLHEAKRQVRPDGVYFEQSLYYHVYALDFFLYARLLAARNEIEIPKAYDDVLARMLDVVEALAQAGPPEGFGDDDGGRVFNPRRNRTEHMTDPLSLGAVMYARKSSAARLTEEAIWLFGDQAVEKLTRPGAVAKPHSIAFPDGGLYILADSEPCPQAIMIDAGPQGAGRAGHGHADALSLRFTMDGQRWLVDSGTGVYISTDRAERNAFRGTAAHNTLRVDQADQSLADEPFSWSHIPTVKTEKWIEGKSFTYFVGSHNGYTRLEDPVVHPTGHPLVHKRHVLKVARGLFLVRDVVLGRAEHELEIRWHFAPDLEVRPVAPGILEISRVGAQPNERSLSLTVPAGTVWQTDIEDTRISPAYGAFQSAPLVRSHARVSLPAETATAFTITDRTITDRTIIDGAIIDGAARHGDNPLVKPRRLAGTTQAFVQAYELDYHNESHGFFFARGADSDDADSDDDEWGYDSWSSDARVLYRRIENEQLTQLVVIGGTHVEWQGQPLLKATGPSDYFEWRKQDTMSKQDTMTTTMIKNSAGQFSTTALFEELTNGSRPVSASNRDSSDQPSSTCPEKH